MTRILSPSPTVPRPLAWALWLVAAALAAVGLRNYRVDNDLSSWAPGLGATGPVRSYMVVGFARDAIDERSVSDALCHLPSVAFCVDREAVAAGGHLMGVTPANFVIGPRADYTGTFLFPRGEVSDEQLVADAQRALDGLPSRVNFNLGGPAAFHAALNQASQQRLAYIMPLILLLGTILMWWLAGDAQAALATAAAITLSQIVLVGGLAWARVPMDVSVSMVPPLMMSFGFSYAAHRSLRRGVTGVLVWCGATTALGFATFLLADVPSVRTFALAGVLGLVIVWLAVMTLVPGPGAFGGRRSDSFNVPTWVRRLWLLPLAHARPVVVSAIALAAVVTCLIPQLRFEDNPLNYFPNSSRLVEDMTTLNDRLTGMLSVQWSVSGQAAPTQLIEAAPGIRKVIDITWLVRDSRRHLWCLADNNALASLARLNDSLKTWATSVRAEISWHGVAAQLEEVAGTLKRTAAISLPTVALVVGAVVGVRSRSIAVALASVCVNMLPVLVLAGIAGWFGWKLDLPSLMIGAIAVGMAVDDTLHIVSSFRRTNSLACAIDGCFRASAGSSLIAAACLSCFAISDFGPIRQFGVLLAIATMIALLSNLVLLPALWPRTRTCSTTAEER